MRKNRFLVVLSFISLSTFTLNAQTFQAENGEYRLIGERSNQFSVPDNQLMPFDSAVYVYNSSTHALDKIYRLKYTLATTTWDSLSIESYAYSTVGANKQQEITYLNNVGGVWTPTTQIVKMYNPNGINLLDQTNYWDALQNAFVNGYKTTYVLDGNNRVSYRYNMNWNTGTSDWDTNNYTRYVYVGTTTRVDSMINYSYDALVSDFVPSNMNTYTYNGQNKETVRKTFIYDQAASSFFESYRLESTYSGNNLTQAKAYTVDWADSSLYDNSITDYTYAGGRVTEEINQTRNSASASYVNSFKYDYTYDANNNPDLVVAENYDAANSQWVNSQRNSFDYNIGNYKTYELYEAWIAINANFRENVERYYHYQVKPNIGVAEEVIKTKISMFPNPTMDVLNVQFSNDEKVFFQVLSLDGKVVKSGMFVSSNNEIAVNELNSGIYILKLTGDAVKGSYKFIKM